MTLTPGLQEYCGTFGPISAALFGNFCGTLAISAAFLRHFADF